MRKAFLLLAMLAVLAASSPSNADIESDDPVYDFFFNSESDSILVGDPIVITRPALPVAEDADGAADLEAGVGRVIVLEMTPYLRVFKPSLSNALTAVAWTKTRWYGFENNRIRCSGWAAQGIGTVSGSGTGRATNNTTIPLREVGPSVACNTWITTGNSTRTVNALPGWTPSAWSSEHLAVAQNASYTNSAGRKVKFQYTEILVSCSTYYAGPVPSIISCAQIANEPGGIGTTESPDNSSPGDD